MIATARPLDPSEMYRATVARDTAYDGMFVLGVRTTGIFCRPTCPARKPLFENVAFFGTNDEARRAGFRPCKRCRPEEPSEPAWVRDLMSAINRAPGQRISDEDLKAQGIEPARARRYFREHFGMTFQAFHRSRRLGLAMSDIRAGGDLLVVGQDHGFDSASGFRDAFARLFGEPPGRASVAAGMLVARRLEPPLGPMIAVANDLGVCLLEFSDRHAMTAQIGSLRRHFPIPVVPGSNGHLDHLADELSAYFAGTLTAFAVPLIYPGSPFQALVWDALRAIPYGKTESYGAIAAKIGQPGASQAVGRANGQNRMAIVIPCHRVVRSDGHLCGYAGGLRRKEWLLDLERGGSQARWRFDEDSPG